MKKRNRSRVQRLVGLSIWGGDGKEAVALLRLPGAVSAARGGMPRVEGESVSEKIRSV